MTSVVCIIPVKVTHLLKRCSEHSLLLWHQWYCVWWTICCHTVYYCALWRTFWDL